MSNRGDNIHKRKDGRWEGRYQKGRRADGKIIYGSVYGHTYKQVKEKLADISCRAPAQEHSGTSMTFGELLNIWLDNSRIRLKGGSIRKYKNLIDTHIAPALGNIKLSDLNSVMINNFLAQKLTSGRLSDSSALSASYVRSIMLVISAAVNYAVNEQLCPPLQTPIYKPALAAADVAVLKLEDQKKLEHTLLSKVDCTNTGILLSLYTGLRIGEVCALSWDDIDFNNHIIKVRHTVARVQNQLSPDGKSHLILDTPKTKASTREIPIPSMLIPILKELYFQRKGNYVVSETDKFLNPRTFEYRYRRILCKSGVEQINYHALRHTFATRCIEAGVDIKSLSEILGHANVGVTLNTYVHSSIELKRKQLEKLSNFTA